MKEQIRLLGIDDSPFKFNEIYTKVIGVIMRGGSYLEGVISKRLSIDGNDGTNVCIDIIKKTKHRKQLKAMLLDGVTLGGFNVIDINEINNLTNLPVITITRDKPDFKKIKYALKKHFLDWQNRLNIIKTGKLYKISTKYKPIYVKFSGSNLVIFFAL